MRFRLFETERFLRFKHIRHLIRASHTKQAHTVMCEMDETKPVAIKMKLLIFIELVIA